VVVIRKQPEGFLGFGMKSRCALGATALLLLPPKALPDRFETGALAAQDMAERGMAAAVPVVEAAVPEPLRVLKGRISRDATLGHVLSDALSPSGVHSLVEAARPVYDLARLSVGHPFGVTFGPDGLVAAFTYGIDELRTLHVIRRDGAYQAEVLTRQYDVRPSVVQGLITSSLYGAVSDAGEDDQLAVDLAEIFAWDVDFNTELRSGDSFRVAVEKLYLDERFVRYGRLLSAELVRGPRVVTALWFDSRNGAGYYTPEGTPLRKAFLRSPLKFSRVSSGFTHARFHPILKTTRPHLGVDYAAPVGTPVRASGGGVVTRAGWDGGYGKTVRIRHPNGYQTLYGHLSRINVKPGQRVEQAEIIGAVGTTGLSTGPHLDYRMTKNGAFIDPRKLKSPRAEPILASERGTFEAERWRQLAFLGTSAPAATAALLSSPASR
jgi:murein DD-endopeptidase MepM/ murein hydrolase activator NlpD